MCPDSGIVCFGTVYAPVSYEAKLHYGDRLFCFSLFKCQYTIRKRPQINVHDVKEKQQKALKIIYLIVAKESFLRQSIIQWAPLINQWNNTLISDINWWQSVKDGW